MKYIVRSLKYFLYLTVILTLVLFVLVKLGIADGNLGTMFVNGYDSFWQIALIIAAFAAIYPRFGYTRRNVPAPGGQDETFPTLEETMRARGYVLDPGTAKTSPESDVSWRFRRVSVLARILKIWEDTVTVTKTLSGYELEGLTKDVTRIGSALDYKFNTPSEL